MGLQFYVGEVQAQINEANRMNNEAKQAISTLQSSISQFLSAPLSGKAYDSAKRYFSVVYTPLCRSATMTGEALVQAHRKLLSDYQGSVSSIDTVEDQINQQINQLEALKRAIEAQMQTAKTMRPDLERRYMNACDSIAKKREKLQKFHDYNSRSASIFSEFDASQREFARGVAQVQNSKAWNSSSGTFDLGRLDMSWAVSINERWEQREKRNEQMRKVMVKNALGKLEGYTIIRTELGEWYLMKNGKYIMADKHPDLYAELEKCKNYLTKDQYSDEKLKINRDEITFVPGLGGAGLLGRGADILRKGTSIIKIGENIVDAINNAPTLNASNETAELDKAREKGEPAKNHKVIPADESKNLKRDGEPNSSEDLLNPDGSVKQRRYYGPDGRALEDIDFNHPDDGTHEFPHRHKWDWDKKVPRQKGEW